VRDVQERSVRRREFPAEGATGVTGGAGKKCADISEYLCFGIQYRKSAASSSALGGSARERANGFSHDAEKYFSSSIRIPSLFFLPVPLTIETC
jgi:hypothetical protein